MPPPDWAFLKSQFFGLRAATRVVIIRISTEISGPSKPSLTSLRMSCTAGSVRFW